MTKFDRISRKLFRTPRRVVCPRAMIVCVAFGLTACSSSPGASKSGQSGAVFTHGVSTGELTATSVVVWARADRGATLHARATSKAGGPGAQASRAMTADHDFTASVLLDGLQPGTAYRYEVWLGGATDTEVPKLGVIRGDVRTAPAADQPSPVAFTWGGDLAGQNACRDAERGFPIFELLNDRPMEFFIALGDMVYVDNLCEKVGAFGNQQVAGEFTIAPDMPNMWAHWKYNRDDPGFRKFLSRVPIYAIWDDHEIVNDAGPQHDTRDTPPYRAGQHLLPLGLRAFVDYNPMPPADPPRLYRAVRWGKHVELFILDTRSYRDANTAPDTGETPKTMLGKDQLAWFKSALQGSDATWKIIISSVPISIPTGEPNARDGWGGFTSDLGFERELLDILQTMRGAGIARSVWITTDVHFGSGFVYKPFEDDPSFEVYEFVSAPLNAGLFPARDFDDSLRPTRLFFHGPDDAASVRSFDEALQWMGFGQVRVTETGQLTVTMINGVGETLYEQTLDPPAAPAAP